MSKLLQEKVNELFEATKDLMSFDEIKPHCEKFNEWINTHTSYSNESLGTVLSSAGFYKKFKSITNLIPSQNAVIVPKYDQSDNVIGASIKHYVLTLCGLTQEQWNNRNKTTRVSERLSGQGQELDPDKYLEVTGHLLESEDPHELAVGLIAATGRRPHEILARAKFSPIEEQAYKVMFSGQGKKRGENVSFEIATLYPAEYIIKSLNRLRKEASTKALLKEVANEFPNDLAAQNRAIDNRRGQSLRRVVKDYFGDKYDENPALEVREGEIQNNNKALRAACAALIVERDYPGSVGSKILAFGRFLGHIAPNENPSDNDLNHVVTSLGYADYYVAKPIPYPVPPQKMNKVSQVRVTESAFEVIKNLQKQLDLPNQQAVVTQLVEFFEKGTKELLEAKNLISQLQTENNKLKELSKMETSQPTQTSVNSSELEAMIGRMIDEKLKSILQQLPAHQPQTQTQTVKESEPITEQPITQTKEKEITEWELKTNKELWAAKSSSAAVEKVRRCYEAICLYNDTVATGDNDRLAITNQALRALSRTNGLLVGDWIKSHADEIISHNSKYGMQNGKDPSKVETYYNKRHGQEKIQDILKIIDSRFLDGQAIGIEQQEPTEQKLDIKHFTDKECPTPMDAVHAMAEYSRKDGFQIGKGNIWIRMEKGFVNQNNPKEIIKNTNT